MIDRMIADLHGTVFKVLTLVNRQREIIDAREVSESLGQTAGSYRESFERITVVLSRIQSSVKAYKSSHSQLLDRVRRYLDQHFADPNLTMDQVAEESGISKPYLSRFFKEKTGINFNQYLLDLRIEKAKELLRDGSTTVGDTAGMAGFGSVRSFNRSFKQFTGISPREFQQSGLDVRASDSPATGVSVDQ
jgi:AraC-like DNA-binding protein